MRLAAAAWACILLAALTVYADTSPPIQVQLRSPWSAPPLLLEILEAAYEEQPSSFFTLLSHITSPWALTGEITNEGLDSKTIGRTLQQATEERIHEAARRILDERDLLIDRGQRHNFELSLALKTQTPKIAAFWQLYDTNGLKKRWDEASKVGDCDSWVDFAGKVICSGEELAKAFESYKGEAHRCVNAASVTVIVVLTALFSTASCRLSFPLITSFRPTRSISKTRPPLSSMPTLSRPTSGHYIFA